MNYESTDLDVCVDCAMLIANGGGDSVEPSWCPDEHRAIYRYSADDCQGDCKAAADAHAQAVEDNWPEPWQLHVGSIECEWCGTEAREAAEHDGTGYVDDCEPWFSWGQCDGCGSRLGGSRMHAVAMRPKGATV